VSPATRQLLEIAQLRGVGPAALREVLDHHPHAPADTFAAAARCSTKISTAMAARDKAREAALRVEEACLKHGIVVLSPWDSGYPTRLRAIPDYPPLLYVRGAAEVVQNEALAVVGTRQASDQGLKAAATLAGFLAKRGITVVSGLALGIDAAAHQGVLQGHGVTIAVLAHGLDQIHPAKNRTLGEQILRLGGAHVSEHPPGVTPRPPLFVQRNRIQSGLCLGSIMVESAAEGGAIHHANFAHQQGRKVFVVTPREKQPDFNDGGARELMRRVGATPLQGTGDLDRQLRRLKAGAPSSSEAGQMDLGL